MRSSSTMPVFPALEEVAMLSSDAIFIVDLRERIISFANSAATSLVNIETGSPLSKLESSIKTVHAEDREYVRNKYSIIASQPSTTNIEFRFFGRIENILWLSCKAYLFNENRFAFVVVTDVTNARSHEEYLVEFGTKKNTLLDTVAHQLNGALSLMNNLAIRAGKLNAATDQPELERFISLVFANSNHCIKIINELLNEEQGELPGVPVKFARVDIVRMVRYVFDEVSKSHPKRNLVFDTMMPVFFLDTDDFKLLQVINNIASNALKFTNETDEIRFILREQSDSLLIAVADSGIGIPEDLQPFLFEKRGPARRTGLNGEKSVGLGLSICKTLANSLKGSVWIESKEGAGTTVFVELPKSVS